MAREQSGCEVLQQDFLHLDLPPRRFDGIYANASLFHVPASELPRVLAELHLALKPRGVLFASNPRGDDEEGWNRGRYGAYHAPATWARYVSDAGFVCSTSTSGLRDCHGRSSHGSRRSGAKPAEERCASAPPWALRRLGRCGAGFRYR